MIVKYINTLYSKFIFNDLKLKILHRLFNILYNIVYLRKKFTKKGKRKLLFLIPICHGLGICLITVPQLLRFHNVMMHNNVLFLVFYIICICLYRKDTVKYGCNAGLCIDILHIIIIALPSLEQSMFDFLASYS